MENIMIDKIEVLAYTHSGTSTRQTEKCPECEGKGEVWTLVVRRFEKCSSWDDKQEICLDSTKGEECWQYREGIKEQTFKVGEKYKFALQTGKCEDCKNWWDFRGNKNQRKRIDCAMRLLNEEKCFEPRIIDGVVREEGINFKIRDNAFTLEFGLSFEQAELLMSLKESKILPNGEYILLKVEVNPKGFTDVKPKGYNMEVVK
jgi:hypothetical protein